MRAALGLLAVALVVLMAPGVALAATGDMYVRTSTLNSGSNYLLVSNITNYPLSGPTYLPAPTVLGTPLMNSLMIGTRSFALSGSNLQSTADLAPWEFTVTSAGTSDGANQGYHIQRGGSYVNLVQGPMDLYGPMGTSWTVGAYTVSQRDFPSQPFGVLSGTPRVWFWDGTRFYTYFTSDTSSIGTYNNSNPGWPGYYRLTASGLMWIDWTWTPSPNPVVNFSNRKLYLAGVRPGPDTLYDPTSSVWPYLSGLEHALTAQQNYFAGTMAVAVSGVEGTGQLPDGYGIYSPSVEVKNISLYEKFIDTTPPVITVPSNMIVEATGPGGAAVTWTAPTAVDAVSGAVTPIVSATSGSTFALGLHTVTVTATDAAGNTASKSFTITVRDTTGPSISGVPTDIVLEATSPSGAVASWAPPSATDLVDGAVTPVVSWASGSTFPVGVTTVSVTAIDAHGNPSATSFTVTAQDTTAPSINGVPADIIVEATSPSGAVASWAPPSATDIVDVSVTPVASSASGSTFPLGVTTVTLTATDAAGNFSTARFTVTVQDTTAPSISGVPADIIVEATSPSGALVTWTVPAATDLVDGAVTPVCSAASGSTFPLGETIVTFTATDAAGNPSTAQFKVRVVDTTAPAISVPADVVVTVTGLNMNGAMAGWAAPTAYDLVDGVVTPLSSRVPGSVFPVGVTIVSVAATDTAGNGSTAQFKVTVLPRPTPTVGSVYFYFNSSRLTPRGRLALQRYARTVVARRYALVSVRGYTSGGFTGGTIESRTTLSYRRARAVRAYLAYRLSLLRARPRITAVGYGAANPVAPNWTSAGRALNRRVEIWAR